MPINGQYINQLDVRPSKPNLCRAIQIFAHFFSQGLISATAERKRKYRAKMSEEQKAAVRLKNNEYQRQKRLTKRFAPGSMEVVSG